MTNQSHSGKVIIMSGVPGSGKSTWARNYAAKTNALIVSADHYFEKYGSYQFDRSKLGEAHRECLKNFIWFIESDIEEGDRDTIVVDNTNTTIEEISVYYKMADLYGFNVTLVTVLCDPEVAFKRCVHNVPKKSFDHMVRNMAYMRVPKHWNIKEEIVNNE